mmetsp:Transcript_37409/g.6713  ORF Transcript_37409/g.6713 Transcript_37409/m.6713 type:complete len:85 (-) Transcript_37409:165-419(-)
MSWSFRCILSNTLFPLIGIKVKPNNIAMNLSIRLTKGQVQFIVKIELSTVESRLYAIDWLNLYPFIIPCIELQNSTILYSIIEV